MASPYLTYPVDGGKYYHIYKKTSFAGPIFYTEANYQLFLKRLNIVLGDMVDLLAFCLMPDRFHLVFFAREVILVKEEYVDHPGDIGHFISEGLRKLFNTYSLAIIKQEALPQESVLLDQNFYRYQLVSDDAIKQAICHIHQLPQVPPFNAMFDLAPFSSYSAIMAKGKSVVDKEAVFALFGDKERFESYVTEGHLSCSSPLFEISE